MDVKFSHFALRIELLSFIVVLCHKLLLKHVFLQQDDRLGQDESDQINVKAVKITPEVIGLLVQTFSTSGFQEILGECKASSSRIPRCIFSLLLFPPIVLLSK